MPDELQVNGGKIRLIIGDITAHEIESFVFYASHDLQVGSGFGTAISVRGGPSIQEELKQHGSLETTEVVISAAGKLNADHIIHAVGPRFQEENLEQKLRTTMDNCLQQAEAKGIKRIAFPAMGAGFFGVPLATCAEVMLDAISDFLTKRNGIEEVVICLLDRREYRPFAAQFSTLTNRVVTK